MTTRTMRSRRARYRSPHEELVEVSVYMSVCVPDPALQRQILHWLGSTEIFLELHEKSR